MELVKIKGIAVETVLFAVILVLALVLLTWLFMKMIPAFGRLIDSALSGIKETVCNMLPWWSKWIFGC